MAIFIGLSPFATPLTKIILMTRTRQQMSLARVELFLQFEGCLRPTTLWQVCHHHHQHRLLESPSSSLSSMNIADTKIIQPSLVDDRKEDGAASWSATPRKQWNVSFVWAFLLLPNPFVFAFLTSTKSWPFQQQSRPDRTAPLTHQVYGLKDDEQEVRVNHILQESFH